MISKGMEGKKKETVAVGEVSKGSADRAVQAKSQAEGEQITGYSSQRSSTSALGMKEEEKMSVDGEAGNNDRGRRASQEIATVSKRRWT